MPVPPVRDKRRHCHKDRRDFVFAAGVHHFADNPYKIAKDNARLVKCAGIFADNIPVVVAVVSAGLDYGKLSDDAFFDVL